MKILPCFFLLLGAVPVSLSAQTGAILWDKPVAKNFTEPAWWDQGVVMVGNWEGLDYRRRMGGQGKDELPENLDQVYLREHSEETVGQLEAAGVNLVVTHFYKMGLKADAADIRVLKAFTALCHRHGIRVCGYVGGSMFTETMVHDVPGAMDWVARDENGVPIRYGAAPYRYLPDFNNPGYVEYMKNVLRIGVQEVGLDAFHFDNMVQPAPPRTASNPDTNRRFQEFLRAKYTPDELLRRFGFSDIGGVTVPGWTNIRDPAALSPIDDPLIQEWVDFRCQDFADYYGKLCDYIRSLNPNVVIELNCAGIQGTNRAYLNGVDHARLVPHGSIFVSEEQNDAQVDAHGILWSKIRSYKLALSLDQTLFTYDGSQQRENSYVLGSDNGGRGGGVEHPLYRTLTAESMAFDRNCFGIVGWISDTPKWPADLLAYIRFYRDHNRDFSAMRQVADVAVLRSFPSLAYNSGEPERQLTQVEQLLIQYKVPFQYVFDGDLGQLSKYRVLVVADQDALSDREVAQIAAYVRGGGGLLATGDTSLFDEWRRRRADYGLADVLGIHYRMGGSAPAAHRQDYGAGRVAYIRDVGGESPGAARRRRAAPAAAGATDPEAGGRVSFALPENATELMAALRYAANGPFSVEFSDAPLTTVMELNEKKDGSEQVLHWLNYKVGSTVAPSAVTVAIPAGRTVTSVEALSPDGGGGTLDFTRHADRVTFTLPELRTYNLAVIHLN